MRFFETGCTCTQRRSQELGQGGGQTKYEKCSNRKKRGFVEFGRSAKIFEGLPPS